MKCIQVAGMALLGVGRSTERLRFHSPRTQHRNDEG